MGHKSLAMLSCCRRGACLLCSKANGVWKSCPFQHLRCLLLQQKIKGGIPGIGCGFGRGQGDKDGGNFGRGSGGDWNFIYCG